MINAPSFGTWKAPGAGTVIPAHLTKQLDIPTGGININSGASSNASKAGAGGMTAMVKAIRGSMAGGDTFNQSVTVFKPDADRKQHDGRDDAPQASVS